MEISPSSMPAPGDTCTPGGCKALLSPPTPSLPPTGGGG
eukprot:CAMPEP_0170181170 /NCGR_PEP_ID=MMETSP0040_2-20121228/24180_1 /TAXON_ID=641309 /ORGANISM="Lotharella oceanica, Strain CCMP622" /LENGTH=38 /DNA_ID= /DNA_START= /DNA_END= /DNA_ORIENTATION=